MAKKRFEVFNPVLRLLMRLILLLAVLSPVLFAGDYTFRDEMGNEVSFPIDRPIVSMDSPGIMQAVAAHHIPAVEVTSRRDGLELIRIIRLRLPEAVGENDPDAVQAVYLLDKDGLIIGYKRFLPGDRDTSFRINGIINRASLFLECDQHGLWRRDLAFLS